MGRTLRLLHLRPLRRQPLRSALVVVAIAAGVTLGLAVLIEYQSIGTSLAQAGAELAGPAPLRVVGAADGALTDAQVAQVRTAPGVAAAVPIVQIPTTVVTRSGQKLTVLAIGVDCTAERLLGSLTCPSQPASGRAPPPALSTRLARQLADGGEVSTSVGRIPTAGAPALTALDAIGSGRVVVFPMPEAKLLFARRGYDAIYIVPTHGASLPAVRAAARRAAGPGTDVLRASDQPVALAQARSPLLTLFLVAAIAAAIGAVLVASVVTLSLAERRRDLAVGAVLGRRPRQIVAGTVLETGLLGLLGGALAVGAAIAIAHFLMASVASTIGVARPMHVHVTVASVVIGIGFGALLAMAAAWLPARRAGRADLTAELSDHPSPQATAHRNRTRLAVGAAVLGLAGLGGALLAGRHGSAYPWQQSVGMISLVACVVGMMGVVIWVGPRLLRQMRLVTDRLSGITQLAGASAGGGPRRASGALLAVAAVVMIGGLCQGLIPTIRASSTRYTEATLGDRVSVAADDLSYLITGPGVPSRVQAAIEALPGVQRIDRRWTLQSGAQLSDHVVLTANEHQRFDLPVQLGHADQAALDRGEVIVSTRLAASRKVAPGSALQLLTPHGPVAVPVAAVWSDPSNPQAATISPALLTRLYGPQQAHQLDVVPEPGVSASALAARIRNAQLDPDLRVWDPDQAVQENLQQVNQELSSMRVLEWALVGVVLVAILTTMLLSGMQRRRELAVLGALGLSPWQLAGMTLAEVGLLAVVGCCLGLIAAVVLSLATVHQAYLFGMVGSLHLAAGPLLLVALGALVAALVGAAWPAHRTARVPIADSLRYE